MLKNGFDVNAAVCVSECTALHIAAESGNVDIEKVLIQYGADVNVVDVVKRTALHLAAREVYVDITKFLLENRADVNAAHNEK